MNKINKIAKKLVAEIDPPSLYVSTYKKYNEGNLDGDWVDLTDFDNEEQFIKYCKQLHKDEDDPEFMFQDYENFPSKYYSESGIVPELWDYLKKIKEYDKSMVDAVIEADYELKDIDDAYIYDNCQDMEDVVNRMIDENGDCFSESTWQCHFDKIRFGKQLQWDYDEDELQQNGWNDMNDLQIANDYLDSIGGLKNLDFETKKQYTDLAGIGRDLDYEGIFIAYDNGYIELIK